MAKKTTYQYRDGDNPLSVANQYGLTPQQLLDANPGGTPFVTGQNILIPQTFQYNPRVTTGPNVLVSPNSPTGSFLGGNPYDRTVNTGYTAMTPAAPVAQPPAGYGPNATFTTPVASTYGTDDSWYRTPQQGAAADAAMNNINNGTLGPTTQQQLTGTPAPGEFYGYERDPETGRSVKVIKNTGSAGFLKELRWDPQERKYVSISRLLKQGKLDLKGNWRNSSKRQRVGAAIARKNQQEEQKQQDLTLSNSFITFNTSAG